MNGRCGLIREAAPHPEFAVQGLPYHKRFSGACTEAQQPMAAVQGIPVVVGVTPRGQRPEALVASAAKQRAEMIKAQRRCCLCCRGLCCACKRAD